MLNLVTDKLAELDVSDETQLHRQRLTAGILELRGDLAFAKGLHEEALKHYKEFVETSQALVSADSSVDELTVRLARAHR